MSVEIHVKKPVRAEVSQLVMIDVLENSKKHAELNLPETLIDHRRKIPGEIRGMPEVLKPLVKQGILAIQISLVHRAGHEILEVQEVHGTRLNHDLQVEQKKHVSLEVRVLQAVREPRENPVARAILGVFVKSVHHQRNVQLSQLELLVNVPVNRDQRTKKQFAS